MAMHRISYILYNYEEDFRPEDFYIIGSNHILLNYITSVLPELDVYGIRQMTMEQLFIRLLYEDWDEEKYTVHTIDARMRKQHKGRKRLVFRSGNFCRTYEAEQIPREPVRLEKREHCFWTPSILITIAGSSPHFPWKERCAC